MQNCFTRYFEEMLAKHSSKPDLGKPSLTLYKAASGVPVSINQVLHTTYMQNVIHVENTSYCLILDQMHFVDFHLFVSF